MTAAITRNSAPMPALASMALARLVTISPAMAGQHPGQHEGKRLDLRRGNAGQPRRLLVAADEIDLPQIAQPAQQQIADDDADHEQNHRNTHGDQPVRGKWRVKTVPQASSGNSREIRSAARSA